MQRKKYVEQFNLIHARMKAYYLETQLNEVEQYGKSYLCGPQMTAFVVALCAKIIVWDSLMFCNL